MTRNIIRIGCDLDLDDVVDEISRLSRGDALAFIEEIDIKMADWDFTMAAYKYFAKLKKVYDDENIGEE